MQCKCCWSRRKEDKRFDDDRTRDDAVTELTSCRVKACPFCSPFMLFIQLILLHHALRGVTENMHHSTEATSDDGLCCCILRLVSSCLASLFSRRQANPSRDSFCFRFVPDSEFRTYSLWYSVHILVVVFPVCPSSFRSSSKLFWFFSLPSLASCFLSLSVGFFFKWSQAVLTFCSDIKE